ncbi:MAG: hypothetical protein J0L84_02165 [Verrucomicrobia bacterium]|nr:hypothetical protein [Verrucomicrobiota bacterium]
MNTHGIIRRRLLEQAGLVELPTARVSLPDLERSEWSHAFEQLMRNRLIMGALRYGCIGAVGKPDYDRVPSMQKRLAAYAKSGNTELLVDVANLCLLEFVEGRHPLRHFHASDDAPHHVQTSNPGKQ